MTIPQASILLAEDQESDVLLVRRALKKAGLTNPLIVARDGQEAVELLDPDPFNDQALSPLPGLLLLDLKMPRMSGFDVLAWIQARPGLKQLPVVVFSGSTDAQDMARAKQLGAADYRIKPSATEDLVAILVQLEGRWLHGTTPAMDVCQRPARPPPPTR